LGVCRWAEEHWPPTGSDAGPVVVGRQLGTKHRRWDTVVVECDPAGLRRRAAFGPEALDSDLLHVVRSAPTEWTWYRDALPEPDYPWRYVREAVDRAAKRGVLERRKRSNRVQIRRVAPYPDWVRRVVAVENKPDLAASAARDLRAQLEHDVALSLADEAWVATRSTGASVEPVLFADLPVEAGVLVFEEAGESGLASPTATVTWYPRSLSVDDPGTRVTDRPAGGDGDLSAARFEYASPEWKAKKRLVIAERVYGRGWRGFVDSMRPDCRAFELRSEAGALLPWCNAKGRGQTAGECHGSCSEFAPEPPAWRTRGPPITGGPGRLQRRLLEDRWRRRRPGLEE
jgi:hypothetical protein